jgi:hypothetical protein
MRKNFIYLMVLILALGLTVGMVGCSDDDDDDDNGGTQLYDVTFQVIDGTMMFMDIMIKGQMTGEDWPTVAMDDSDGDYTWEVTIEDIAPGTYEWGAVENYADAELSLWLIEGNNLSFTLEDDGTVTGQTMYEIAAPAPNTLTFRVVDGTMGYQNIKIKGDMTGENWPTVAMDDTDGDHIWTVTIDSIMPGTYEWGAIEDDGSEWGIWLIEGENRKFVMGDDGNVIPDSSQTTYVIPVPTEGVPITFQVDMSDADVSGSVYVAGGFTNWQNERVEMMDDDEDGIYEATIDIAAGSTHQYKFMNGDTWETVPQECGVDDGYGGYNREITIPDTETTIGYVWETCDEIGGGE